MNPKICPTCQAPIPPHAPGGFCPACLLRDADEPPANGHAAPSLDEIAAAFPQLEVIGLIGQGGMGFVYQVRQPGLDRTVALKILSPELGRDPAFAERFARESRALGKLNHPNIVTVFEHGESGGFFYLLMEYVDGVNLRQAMRAGRFTPEQALAIVPGICDALQAAHAQGIWHRDIKPENILLDARGGVKIADFGIARMIGDPQRNFTLTMTGGALGSAAYMAPEQHETPRDVDHRADIYSLGVVIYEMLTGELPLGRFPAPSQRAAVDARIDEIVFKTLEKERELRQQSATEVKTEMEAAHHGVAPSVRHTSPLRSGRLDLLLGSAIALLVIACILVSPRWRFSSETAKDFSQLLLGLSVTFSAICGILVVYLSRPGRIVGILGLALAGLVLLLVIEGRGATTLALWAAALIGVGAVGAWLLSDRETKEVIGSRWHPKRPSDPASSRRRDLRPLEKERELRQQSEKTMQDAAAESASDIAAPEIASSLTRLPRLVRWSLGLFLGGGALMGSAALVADSFKTQQTTAMMALLIALGGAASAAGLLGTLWALWALYEMKRGTPDEQGAATAAELAREKAASDSASSSTHSSGLVRWSVGLFLTGILAPPLLLTFFPRQEEPAVAFGVLAVFLALVLGAMSWRERLGKFVVIATCVVLLVFAAAMVRFHGMKGEIMHGAEMREKARKELRIAEFSREIREPRPRVTPPQLPAPQAVPAVDVFDVFRKMNAAANAANAEEFRSYMANSGHADGELKLPIETYMNLFVGKIGKAGAMTSSENPERAGEIHLDVRFDEVGGKGAHESSYRFRAEQGHWRFLFDGFVDHRVSSRIEVTPLDINTLELLKKVIYGPCDVTPVQDARSQFDLVATCLSEDEAIAWANYFAGNAEDLLRQRGFLGSARIIGPAKRKTEPTPEARIEELEKYFNPELPQFKTQYRATCRIEVRVKKGNTEALLNEAMGKFCTVVPVPGVNDQFDLVVTDPDPAQTSRLANSLGKDAEELLKEREVHGTVKIIKPAERPEKPIHADEGPASPQSPMK